jgi:hypothetical protein
MFFKATFYNISVISWRSVLLMEETGVYQEKPTDNVYCVVSFLLDVSILIFCVLTPLSTITGILILIYHLQMFLHRYIISYLGVIGGVQNFTPVLKFIHQGAHPWLHQDNEFISYEAVYAKKKNQTKNKQKFSYIMAVSFIDGGNRSIPGETHRQCLLCRIVPFRRVDFEFLCFNATFNNISAILWRPVLVVEEAGVPGENHRPWTSNW